MPVNIITERRLRETSNYFFENFNAFEKKCIDFSEGCLKTYEKMIVYKKKKLYKDLAGSLVIEIKSQVYIE